MSADITYCSAFPEDTVFGTIINSSQFRWTSSCIANPEYEYEDMLKAVLHALTPFESNDTPFLVVLILPVCDNNPMELRFHPRPQQHVYLDPYPTGHMRCVLAHRQSDDMTATLPPAKWLGELVLISYEAGREHNYTILESK